MVHCSYACQIWKDVEKTTAITDVWMGLSIIVLEKLVQKKGFKNI
jgi:hypothetical protein